MTTNDDRKRPEKLTPKRKRFRIEKLEERIAPTPHLNPHTNPVGGGGGNGNGNGNTGGGGGGGSVVASDTIGGGSIY